MIEAPHLGRMGGKPHEKGKTCKLIYTAEVGLDPQPWRCEAAVLHAEPTPFYTLICYFTLAVLAENLISPIC